MRVSFLSVSDQLGGSETMLLQVLAEVRRDHPDWLTSVVLPGAGPLAVAAEAAGARVITVPMPDALRRLGEWAAAERPAPLAWRLARVACVLPGYQRAMGRALQALGPDVIHSNGFKTHIVSARLRRRAALLWHIHEYVSTRPLTRRLLARYGSRADLIVANSHSVAADVANVTGSPVATIHNGVDLDRFSPSGPRADLDAAAGLPAALPGTVRVGLVATFSRWKGHVTFLRALGSLPPDCPVRGYIVGGPVYDTAGSQHSVQELRRVAFDLGLEGRVGFTGFLSPVESAIRALDVVVHASTDAEAFGLVIAEAMACERPVITTGAGGSAELIWEGETAFRHAPGDHVSLAGAIKRLATDSDLRVRLGRAARLRAARLFDARRLGGQFADAYARAIEVRGRA
jgi:glycosyltransferase involved in cell wall biosynthesis